MVLGSMVVFFFVSHLISQIHIDLRLNLTGPCWHRTYVFFLLLFFSACYFFSAKSLIMYTISNLVFVRQNLELNMD